MSQANIEIPILMYHRIGERIKNSLVRDQYVPLSLFERQLATLQKAGYVAVSLDEMRLCLSDSSAIKGKPIVITFDDGYESFITHALPAIKKYGMKATVFLVANCVGQTNRWDEAKGDVSERLMDWDQVLAVHQAGMEIGAHTMTHPDLRFCDDSLAEREIAGSKAAIEGHLGSPIHWFSYPYGKHSERERKLVLGAGFLGATGTEKHTNNSKTNPYALGRVNVRATTSPMYLMQKLRKASNAHA